MEILETGLKDCYLLKPRVFEDERGYFFESYNSEVFKKNTGLDVTFVQDNQSFSSYGVIRGLHAQGGEHAQAKLVRVLSGEVLDVAVDARPESPTYGRYVAVKLSADNKMQVFIPRGFLHGFIVLSSTATFFYKCDNFYNKAAERGVRYDSSALGIDWIVPKDKHVVSEKDLELPMFGE